MGVAPMCPPQGLPYLGGTIVGRLRLREGGANGKTSVAAVVRIDVSA